MKIGFPLGGTMHPDNLIRLARFAESLGVDYLSTNNRLAPFDRDTFVRLTLLATNTERPTIGAWSVNPFLHHPVTVGRAMATIDELAPGRVYLGWVAGSPAGLGSVGFGAEAHRPLKRMREAVELSKLILSGNIPEELAGGQEVRQDQIPDEYKVNYSGELFQMVGNVVLPSRKVPVGIHTFSRRMLQLGGEIADEVLTGWFANAGGNDWALEQIAAGAARSGRSPDAIKVHRSIHLAVWPDRELALQAITPITQITLLLASNFRKNFGIKLPFEKEAGEAADRTSEAFRYGFGKLLAAYSGSTELAREIPIETHLEMAVAGTPDDCIEQLQRTVVDPRFDVLHVALFVPPPEPENLPKALELLMKEIVPAINV